ncbi:hypothetical protein C8T65DRAFT_28267 [Cerioporus squamosus]|nr:hypothetical protein C8T65DRAFT_28267 [Cerioporus squamosus]
MPPAISGIAALPVELLLPICDAADRSDLYSIALTSNALNDIVTPSLYSTIDLHLCHAIYACMRTLASAPTHTVMKRDLASFVETLSLRDIDAWTGRSTMYWQWEHISVIRRRLGRVVPRMWRLRSITYRLSGSDSNGRLFTSLASRPFQFIHEIDVVLLFRRIPRHDPPAADNMVAPGAIAVRGLKSLKLNWIGTPSVAFVSFTCSLLIANHLTLRVLAVPDEFDLLWSAWQSIPSFPALEELKAPAELLREPPFQDTSSITRYLVPNWWNDVEFAPTALPNLQELTCCPNQLEAFLPEDANHRRPINTITLNHARYERTRSGGEVVMDEYGVTPRWRYEISPALRAVRFSASRLVRLSVAAVELSAGALSDLLPLLTNLEYLLIVLLSISADQFSMLRFRRWLPYWRRCPTCTRFCSLMGWRRASPLEAPSRSLTTRTFNV